jgi:hypothetical protein
MGVVIISGGLSRPEGPDFAASCGDGLKPPKADRWSFRELAVMALLWVWSEETTLTGGFSPVLEIAGRLRSAVNFLSGLHAAADALNSGIADRLAGRVASANAALLAGSLADCRPFRLRHGRQQAATGAHRLKKDPDNIRRRAEERVAK